MRIAIRADASDVIGTGHVMRQLAFAESLLQRKDQVTLFGSIPGPRWLISQIERLEGLRWVRLAEGEFGSRFYDSAECDALMVDSYLLNQFDLERLQAVFPRVAVMIDGPGQQLAGKVAVAAVLWRGARWLESCRNQFQIFHSGPEFLMFRKELIEARRMQISAQKSDLSRVVVSLGGTNYGDFLDDVLEILEHLAQPVRVDVFSTKLGSKLSSRVESNPHFRVHENGLGFPRILSQSNFAITAGGTTVAELAFLGIPGIFLPVASNQKENMVAVQELGLGGVVDPYSGNFRPALKHEILEVLGKVEDENFDFPRRFDPFGADRVRRALLGENSAGASALGHSVT